MCWEWPGEIFQVLILSGTVVVPRAYNLNARLNHIVRSAFSLITALRFCPSHRVFLGMNFSFGDWKMKHHKESQKAPQAESLTQVLDLQNNSLKIIEIHKGYNSDSTMSYIIREILKHL